MSLRDALRSLLPTTRAQPSDDPHRLPAQFRALMATRTPTPPEPGLPFVFSKVRQRYVVLSRTEFSGRLESLRLQTGSGAGKAGTATN